MNLLAETISPVFDFGDVEIAAWQVVVALLVVIAAIALPLIIFNLVRAKQTGEKFTFTTQEIAYAAICLSMSYVLSFFGYKLPQGGTITPASILPVAIFCYYFGFRKGSVVCSVYLLLQLTQNPMIVNVWSMLLDYVVPYLALSLTGAISYKVNSAKKTADSKRPAFTYHWGFFAGMLIYVIIRYASHIVAGIVFYAEYATGNVVAYSFAYNSFCLIDMGIAVAGAIGLFSSRTFAKTMSDAVIRIRSKMNVVDRSAVQSAD